MAAPSANRNRTPVQPAPRATPPGARLVPGWRKPHIHGILTRETKRGEPNMTIARILTGRSLDSVISAPASMPVRDAIALLAEHRIGALPVMEGSRCVGIFSERDVIYCLAKDGAAALDRPVSELMSGPPVTVSPETDVIEALALITRRRFRHLPVIRGEEFAGFISIGDLVKFRLDAVEKEAEAMRSYIQTA
jgi:CBS domain-containing protein